jgi:YfiH family protein
VRVEHVFTTRHGGVSTGPYESLNLGLHVGDDPDAVVENRRRAAALLGASLDDLVLCTQTHGRTVIEVGVDDRGRVAGEADALVTRAPGVVLAVLVADCVPILLADAEAGVVACVHAGWRGTVADVVGATVDAMGTDPAHLTARLGPAVRPERYQVGHDVFDAATAIGLDGALRDDPEPDHWRFDLWSANETLLRRAGVTAIDRTDAVATGDAYFSDRAVRPCGRFGLLAVLRP